MLSRHDILLYILMFWHLLFSWTRFCQRTGTVILTPLFYEVHSQTWGWYKSKRHAWNSVLTQPQLIRVKGCRVIAIFYQHLHFVMAHLESFSPVDNKQPARAQWTVNLVPARETRRAWVSRSSILCESHGFNTILPDILPRIYRMNATITIIGRTDAINSKCPPEDRFADCSASVLLSLLEYNQALRVNNSYMRSFFLVEESWLV